jgi:ferredoxin-fold anticodon binding domain-containing protein
MLDVNDKFFDGKMEFTFIEPNPERLNDLLKSNDKSLAKIIVKNVQTVDLEEFKALEANDMLLIDSSHITKTGSDVNFLIFQVFPVLKPGVIIHIHDIFDGFEYPEKWIISGRSWNESYILRAFLQNNSDYEMLFFSDYLQQHHKEAFVSSIDPKRYLNGSAIYLRKK